MLYRTTVLALALAILLAVVVAEAAGLQGRTVTVRVPSQDHGRALVYGCDAEDTCRMDYRVLNNGRPAWVVRRTRP
jgi:hypothetical protein